MSRRVEILIVATFADDVTDDEIREVAVDAFAQVDDPQTEERNLPVEAPATLTVRLDPTVVLIADAVRSWKA